MKISLKLFFILAVLLSVGNVAFAEETVILNNVQWQDSSALATIEPQPIVPEVVLIEPVITGTQSYSLTKGQIWQGVKYKVFADKFVFQIDAGKYSSGGTLNLKEMILPPNSNMAPKDGLQLASRIYEYDWRADKPETKAKAIWFSIKYDSDNYFRKNIYYFDQAKNEWIGIPGIISNYSQKIIATFPLPYAKIAILEDVDIMTDGVASWYKYKGCDCAASPDYPKGTKLKVTNLDNGKTVIVKVNDWGPDRSVHPNRVIDLDVVAFKKIASKSQGLCKVKVELVESVKAATK